MSRWQVPVVLAAVAAGLAAGVGLELGTGPEVLVVPALVALLALTFAGVRPESVRDHVRPHGRVVAASLALNFGWAPAAAGLLGLAFLAGEPDLRVGLVMLLVTPCTDWYLVFTATARGNVALAAALLPVNLVLQLALLPLFVVLLAGPASGVPIGQLAGSVAIVVGVPLAVAVLARTITARLDAQESLDAVLERLQGVGLVLLAVAIWAIFAAHADTVSENPGAFVRLLLPLAVFFAVTYVLATAAARKLDLHHPERVTLTMTTLARNSPVALAIATAAFPDRPLIAVALVVGPLIELPVLAVVAHRLGPDRLARSTRP